MDRNAALSVLFLVFIVANVSNAKKIRNLADDPSNQVSGENKPDPKPVKAGKNPENAQGTDNSSNLDPKTDLVSPPAQNQTKDNSKNLDSTNSGREPVDARTVNNENSSSNGMDLLNPGPVNETNNGKSWGSDKEKNVNDKSKLIGADLLSPDPVNEADGGKNGGNKEKNINDESRLNGTDLRNPIPVSKADNGKDGGSKEKNIDHKSRLNGTNLFNPIPVNETDNGKKAGNKEKDINDKSGLNSTDLLSPFPVNETDNEKNGGNKEKNIDDKSKLNGIDLPSPFPVNESNKNGGNKEDKSGLHSGVNETCKGLPKCTDLKTLVACVKNFDSESRKVTVLVQNEGEKTLRVNFAIPAGVENPPKLLEIPKHESQKVTILLSVGENTKLILDAGNGECVLHTDLHKSDEQSFVYLPSYHKLITPINGAYFLLFSVIIFGGTWACCKFRRTRSRDGIAYQELEMGLPESVPSRNAETAEGWDQGWDDDWNEDNAVKSPGASHRGSISANGLTSRSPNRDGWDQNWDD